MVSHADPTSDSTMTQVSDLGHCCCGAQPSNLVAAAVRTSERDHLAITAWRVIEWNYWDGSPTSSREFHCDCSPQQRCWLLRCVVAQQFDWVTVMFELPPAVGTYESGSVPPAKRSPIHVNMSLKLGEMTPA